MRRKKKVIFLSSSLIVIAFCLIFLGVNISTRRIENKDYNTKSVKKYGCEFTRTYRVYAVYESNDKSYFYVTIRGFQNEDIQTIKISKNVNKELIPGKNYEFKFKQNDNIPEDGILNIYNNSDIVSIKETTSEGNSQINENFCN